MLPLDGCHVLDLSLLLPGPLCAQILRDLGAEVTKVEPPAPGDYAALWPPMVGDVSASYFAVNRGKHVVTLNLKQPDDRERFHELARTADIVVEGFQARRDRQARRRLPDAQRAQSADHRVQHLGLRADRTLRAASRSRSELPGVGRSAVDCRRRDRDAGQSALAGGRHGRRIVRRGDACAGGALGTAADWSRAAHRCKHVGAAIAPDDHSLCGRPSPGPRSAPRRRAAQWRRAVLLHVSHLRRALCDDRALEPKFWQVVVEKAGVPELANIAFHGGEGAEKAIQRLADVFASKTRDQWAAIFGDADACFEPVLCFSEVLSHPHWLARGSFEAVPTPDGRTLRLPRMPGSLAGFGRA